MGIRRASLALVLVGTDVSCILPDTGIQVYATQGCGSQYVASTAQATGITGDGKHKPITTIEDEWIVQRWCLSPEQSALMQYENSSLYLDILRDVIEVCKARAIELELGQDTCSHVAAIAYSGECAGENEWCDAQASEDEIGFELDMLPSPTR